MKKNSLWTWTGSRRRRISIKMLNVTLRKLLLRLSFRRDSKQLTIH